MQFDVQEEVLKGDETINMGTFDISAEKAEEIAKVIKKFPMKMLHVYHLCRRLTNFVWIYEKKDTSSRTNCFI